MDNNIMTIDIPKDKQNIFKDHKAEDFEWSVNNDQISVKYKGNKTTSESRSHMIVFDYFTSIKTVDGYNRLEVDFFNEHDSDPSNLYAEMNIILTRHIVPEIRISSHRFENPRWTTQIYNLSDLLYAYNKLNINDFTKSVITSNFWDIDQIIRNDVLTNNIFANTHIDISDGLLSDKNNAMRAFGMTAKNKEGSIIFSPNIKDFIYSDTNLVSALISMSIVFSIYRFLFGVNIFIENRYVNESYNAFLKIQPDFWHNANEIKIKDNCDYAEEC